MAESMFILVRCLSGRLAGQSHTFIHPAPLAMPPVVMLGRSKQSLLRFDDEQGMVAERHVELRVSGDRVWLRADAETLRLPEARPIEECMLPQGTSFKIQLGVDGPICELVVGRVVPFGHYLLTGCIGKGGMGEVFLARDRHLPRYVVLKLIKKSFFSDVADAQKMLLDEANIVSQLEDSHVVRIHDIGQNQSALFIAMEYLRGITLRELLRQLKRLDRRLPPAMAAAIVSQACLGLHAAHELPAQAVHRDVSPNNIMITRDGVKVIDFGLARAKNRLGPSFSERGQVAGCPPYMSPEQIATPKEVDRRTDVFSAGVVLYELCTGESPFSRDDIAATIQAVLTCRPPPLRSQCSEVSESLAQIVSSALERDPRQRPQTAYALASALRQEAGSELAHHDNLLSCLYSLGLSIEGPVPQPLIDIPELLRELPAPLTGARSGPLRDTATVRHSRGRQARAIAPPGAPDTSEIPLNLPQQGGRTQCELGGQQVDVRHVVLPAQEDPEAVPVPLQLPYIADNSHQPLTVKQAHRVLEVRALADAVVAGRPLRLYQSEVGSDGARSSLIIPSVAANARFYVGHHRAQVREVGYSSTARDSAGTADLSIVVSAQSPRLRIRAPAHARRLVALYAQDPCSRVLQVACFTVRSS